MEAQQGPMADWYGTTVAALLPVLMFQATNIILYLKQKSAFRLAGSE